MNGAIPAGRRGRGAERPACIFLRFTGPVAIGIAAWTYLTVMIGDMSTIPGVAAMMLSPQAVTPVQLLGLLLMWAVMMAAMMLPTVIPMVKAYARMHGAGPNRGAGELPVLAFSVGYVIAWAGFSVGATLLQSVFTQAAWMSPMMMKLQSPVLAGSVVLIAGLYQFTPLKRTCLGQCRSPMSFLITQWREGSDGALCMGLRHGAFCVGCCWALMALLFVGGVMNTFWIVAIMLYVLIEKIAPGNGKLTNAAGLILVGSGLGLIFF